MSAGSRVRPKARTAAALVALFMLPANAPDDPAVAFGARESIEDIGLSPDGRRIFYLAPYRGQGSRVFSVDLATGESVQTTAVDGEEQRLGDCAWVSAERLVCTVFALRRVQTDVAGASRFVALDFDGTDPLVLGDYRTGSGAGLYDIVDWHAGTPGSVLVAGVMGRRASGVFRVDTVSNATEIVQDGITYASRFLTDGRGTLRIHGARRIRGATEMDSEEIEFRFRVRGSSEWRPLGVHNSVTREGLYPLAVDAELDAAYALDKLNGRMALYRIALDGSGRRELLVSHDEVDVDGLLRLGPRGRVIGATYATDMRQFVYFDPELRALAAGLSRALPELPLVRFLGASDDESTLLVWAGSDRDPGRYYTYSRETRRLNEIMLARPQLEGVELAEVRPIRYAAADGTLIPGYLTLPPGREPRSLPAIVMPHGGPESRDEWGFDWLVQYFAHRGFAVLQPNFRGSAGYGDEWFRQNGFRSWRIAVGDVSDAGRWLVGEGIADPDRLAILGWSYGGFAALQSAVVDPDLFKAVVAIAPVADLRLLQEESRGWTNFRLLRDFIGSGPHVTEGSPAQNAARIRAPVLLFHGDLDENVNLRHSRLMADHLRDASRPVELVVFEGLDHDLQDSAARARLLRESEALFQRAFGGQ